MADPAFAERLLSQAANADRTVADLDVIVAQAAPAATRIREAPDDVILIMGGGGLLHGFYASFEHLLLDVAESVNGHAPAGDAWHARLLDQLSHEVPGVRPAVFPVDLRSGIDDLRAFRHLYRNLYVFNLRADRVAELLDGLPPLWMALRAALTSFSSSLRTMAGAM